MKYITNMTEVRKQLQIHCAGRECASCPLHGFSCNFEFGSDAEVAEWYTMINPNAYVAIALDE